MEQKTQNKLTIAFVVFFGICFLIAGLSRYFWSDANVVLDGKKLNVLIAEDSVQQFKGLGGRKDFGEYDGMIFIYDEAFKIGVVMRDMEMPIDVVWFYDGKVVDIAPNLQPEPGVKEADLRVYLPRGKANVFLELEAGWTEKNGLKIGDELKVVE
ncbi:MAG: hypothetical protein A2469_01495 [Candidatus Magasanikbacteria bacterium RIFOXYC2_FULL_40_16]|uniref:DUF192 domain-containing protein n=2 Tax=Candidatus Magasanikiibacteriota TaxID=1752731 RepID=A0A1F6NG89_9BACT|nr:MAG: hypothetical protein A2373_04690 [Candidatus Magasanikbacteria bacterium RIFOXYB1_FULL_40_15]OGH85471.1 MAG: hypothetical protein A2301_03925 [Candidatus Magasanikbacteria bacterium RIFOXYB2_FULL_40_13]OGH89480.1 MAG: hypothetical protein A2469_01495 [Candidatus Magasanikbacteria bacterium RIFOXYC2_FULL_40_16]